MGQMQVQPSLPDGKSNSRKVPPYEQLDNTINIFAACLMGITGP